MTLVKGGRVIGIFEHQDEAIQALRKLKQTGFSDDELELVRRGDIEGAPTAENVGAQRQAGRGALVGAIGGLVAGIAGALICSLIMVQYGRVIGILTGGAFAAAVGAFFGPFLSLATTKSEATPDAGEHGWTVVVVNTDDRQDDARELLRAQGAYDDRMHSEPEVGS